MSTMMSREPLVTAPAARRSSAFLLGIRRGVGRMVESFDEGVDGLA
jgi:hypothetical protein